MRGREDEGTEMRKKGVRGGGGRQKEVNRKQGEVDKHRETEGGKKERERVIARGSFLHT